MDANAILTGVVLGYSFVLLVVVPVAFWFNGRIDG